ncbi:hypothetical protein QLH52_24405 [Methylomonas sp. OY6]|uniref:Uncharacterized protein n=1 Tax=Methylomonas defluvii TaxID=3045149 RepID=A0ABU4UP11_9GAMM|nr:hypothetical protein [Methylomonas sp. OY6]MDX8130454.1 hypothetical protein [Methylomonas sp. OY6]
MKFNALFIGSLAGTLAAVAAFVVFDSWDSGFFLSKTPKLIVFPLMVAAAQTLLLALPVLLLLNHFKRLNGITWVLIGALCAALPWSILLLATPELVAPTFLWLALCGAIGGIVGHITARAVSPNNSSKPTPLRGAA